MSAVIIVGDIHLGKGVSIGKPGVGTALNSRIVDQLNLLDWVYEQAMERNVDTLILAGDIFDDDMPDYKLVNLLVAWLKLCAARGINIHIVGGNHDMRRVGGQYESILDLLITARIPLIHLYKQITTIFVGKTGITLLPFRDRACFGEKTNKEALDFIANQLVYESLYIPDDMFKVLVGHLALEGSIFVGDEFDYIANELMCPLSMFSDYEYTWMGHVHKPQVRAQEPYMAHIGSLDISDFGEVDHVKKIIYFDANDVYSFEEIPVPTRPLRKVALEIPTGFDPTDYIIKNIKKINEANSLNNAIVRMEFKILDRSANQLNRDKVEKAVYDMGAHHICNFSESRSTIVVAPSKQKDIDNTIDPKAGVKLFAEEKKDMFKTEKQKQKYIDYSNSIIDEHMAKVRVK